MGVEGADIATLSYIKILEHKASLRASKYKRSDPELAHAYSIVASILKRVRKKFTECVSGDRKSCVVSPRNSLVLPGALYIARMLLRDKITLDEAARITLSVIRRAKRYLSILEKQYNLKLVIPKSVDPEKIHVDVWVDKVGEQDMPGARAETYALVLFFWFPFDVSKVSGKSEYEPVVFYFREVERDGKRIVYPVEAYTRIHYDPYRFVIEDRCNLELWFLEHGHTPKLEGKHVVGKRVIDPGSVRSAAEVFVKDLGGLLRETWLHMGRMLTLRVRELSLSDLEEGEKLSVMPVLHDVDINPLVSKVYPSFKYSRITYHWIKRFVANRRKMLRNMVF